MSDFVDGKIVTEFQFGSKKSLKHNLLMFDIFVRSLFHYTALGLANL